MSEDNIIIVSYNEEKLLEKFTKEEIDQAILVLKGITHCCELGTVMGYTEGNRNDLAVDLSISCYILNQDPYDIGAKLLLPKDFFDLNTRLNIIKEYLDGWYRRSRLIQSKNSNMLNGFGQCNMIFEDIGDTSEIADKRINFQLQLA